VPSPVLDFLFTVWLGMLFAVSLPAVLRGMAEVEMGFTQLLLSPVPGWGS
jgi:hypothetical protein